jgi:hypothetical protein
MRRELFDGNCDNDGACDVISEGSKDGVGVGASIGVDDGSGD